jgi:hypothetical protein
MAGKATETTHHSTAVPSSPRSETPRAVQGHQTYKRAHGADIKRKGKREK